MLKRIRGLLRLFRAVLDPSAEVVVDMAMVRTEEGFGCEDIGRVPRVDFGYPSEEWIRLYALAESRGYEILSYVPATNVARVRLPRP